MSKNQDTKERPKPETRRPNQQELQERLMQERERGYKAGFTEATLELLTIIDDCDRALELMRSDEDNPLFEGVKQLQERTLKHFERLGYHPFGSLGDTFDPNFHEAVSVEPGIGEDGTVARIHRRGWMNEDKLVRPAMVTVLQGSIIIADEGVVHRRRKRHVVIMNDYICPYGIPGCTGDCPGCAPPPLELSTTEHGLDDTEIVLEEAAFFDGEDK